MNDECRVEKNAREVVFHFVSQVVYNILSNRYEKKSQTERAIRVVVSPREENCALNSRFSLHITSSIIYYYNSTNPALLEVPFRHMEAYNENLVSAYH